jgi:hypothetical protein
LNHPAAARKGFALGDQPSKKNSTLVSAQKDG